METCYLMCVAMDTPCSSEELDSESLFFKRDLKYSPENYYLVILIVFIVAVGLYLRKCNGRNNLCPEKFRKVELQGLHLIVSISMKCMHL